MEVEAAAAAAQSDEEGEVLLVYLIWYSHSFGVLSFCSNVFFFVFGISSKNRKILNIITDDSFQSFEVFSVLFSVLKNALDLRLYLSTTILFGLTILFGALLQ
jgi:hypothetical protein